MGKRLSRASALWLVDHALPVAGAVLLAAGALWSPWLTPLGWTALGLAALAWLAESNGYAIPRPGRAPIVGFDCGEVPLAFGVSRGGRHFLFARQVAQMSDPWPDEYSVYEMPSVDKFQVASGFWCPPAGARKYNGVVPTEDLRFEHHEHSYVDSASLGRALDRVVPRAA
jgi:hypothetical protein